MSVAFSAKISMLRKEKGITQKKAAADLKISQALLSHYEKGIRECNLDFVTKAAVYYGVSTDYLLGLTELKHGAGTLFSASEIEGDGEMDIKTLLRALLHLSAQAENDPTAKEFFEGYFALSVQKYTAALTGATPSADRRSELCMALLAEKQKKNASGEKKPETSSLALQTVEDYARELAASLIRTP